jgi:hypothetical protein
MAQAAVSPSNLQSIKSEGSGKTFQHPIYNPENGYQKAENHQKPENSSPSNHSNHQIASPENLVIQQLQAELIRLKGHLDEKDRKYRELDDEYVKKRRELENEISRLNKELSDGQADLKLTHQEKLYTQEKEYEKQLREKEDKIRELEWDIRLNKVESKNGDRSIADRFMDFFEDNGTDFFAKVVEGLQKMSPGGQPVQNPTPQQLQSAFNHAANAQNSENPQPQKPENSQNQEFETRQNAENQQQTAKELTPEQMEEVKSQIRQSLIERALHVLTNPNANFQEYAMNVQQQLALNRANGIQLDAGTWIQMAKVLSEKAIEKEITAERVAKVIEPVLGGAKKYSFFLNMMDSKQITEKLFNQFNIEANEQVKALVVKVFDALKNMK